jgi:acetyltransferase-like isoleucine patch superfamily enzyme
MLFYKMMGMKIGKNAHINTTNISDPRMIEIGDNVTIGGSVHIIAHYAAKGFLIVDKVKIHDHVTIGLKASIMGAVEIGEKAVIGPHEVILPKTKIPSGRKPLYPEWQGKETETSSVDKN